MKLSALLLTFVIAFGSAASLEARTKNKTPKPPKHATAYKVPKRKTKPTKMKPMKFHKAKHAGKAGAVKPAKVRKSKTPASV